MSSTAISKPNLDDIAASTLALFPTLNSFEQSLSLELYRLLVEGQPVPRTILAERLGVSVDLVSRVLDSWPAVFSDSLHRVVGYWGLSIPAAYASSHHLTINGRRLEAWCAWDTLFLPQLLGQTLDIESTSPISGEAVHLTVAPQAVKQVDPAGAQMSFLLPDSAATRKDVVNTFCCFVHFFPSRQTAESWAARHTGTFLLSIEEAHALARRKNETQYKDVLR